jgi:hypothetical protein
VIAFRDAARDLEVDRLVVAGVARDEIVHELGPFGVAERIREADRLVAPLETHEVLGEPEGPLRIDRDHLVDAVAEDEPAIEHRDVRLLDGGELAVQIYDFAHMGSVI